jgi:hypothetical protein
MSPHPAFEDRPARPRARGGTSPPEPGTQQRLALVTAVQDAQRKRRTKKPLKRLTAIVPVSDYRDVFG